MSFASKPGVIRIVSGLICQQVESRFIQAPKKEVVERLEKQQGEIKEEVVNLEKKLHYLETTYKNSREHLDQILKRSSGS